MNGNNDRKTQRKKRMARKKRCCMQQQQKQTNKKRAIERGIAREERGRSRLVAGPAQAWHRF